MTTSHRPNMTDNLKEIRSEGSHRAQKIGRIFQTAWTDLATELKEGTTTIRPLAQELAQETAAVVKEKGQAVNANVRKALQETTVDDRDLLERLKLQVRAILRAIRDTLLTRQTDTADAPQLGEGASQSTAGEASA
jgi:hypothetical protein